jgi:hypothetical protein
MRVGFSLLPILLIAALPGVAAASTPILVTTLAASDSVAGPFVIHVRVTSEGDSATSRVVCVVEAVSDPANVSKAWGRLEAGARGSSAMWCSLAPDISVTKPDKIRFSFGLRRDLAEVARFYLSIPAPRGGVVWSWEINLASYLSK